MSCTCLLFLQCIVLNLFADEAFNDKQQHKNSTKTMRNLAAVFVALLVIGSDCFQMHVVTHDRHITGTGRSFGFIRPTLPLQSKAPEKDDVDRNEARRRSDAIGGTGTEGKTLLILGFLLSVWFFTVPPEFRRSRLCTEAETAQNPDVCMTCEQFVGKVVDYYANGGGIQWDFSVAKETKDYFDK